MVVRSDNHFVQHLDLKILVKMVKCGTHSVSRSDSRSLGWLSVRTVVRSDNTPSWSFRSSYTLSF
ncbi:hypothetical protein HanRHA438_Chr03g0143821 [Helianthus annuus]|nr:hypothetical protein HanRHA438_Chr03g0143821 [Helianthus annuus]